MGEIEHGSQVLLQGLEACRVGKASSERYEDYTQGEIRDYTQPGGDKGSGYILEQSCKAFLAYRSLGSELHLILVICTVSFNPVPHNISLG